MNGRVMTSMALVLLLGSFGSAATHRLTLTVDAGRHDRTNSPACVMISVPESLANAPSVTLRSPDGRAIPGQLTAPGLLARPITTPRATVARELHFIIPQLKAGEKISFNVTISDSTAKEKRAIFHWEEKPGQYIDLFYGTRPVMRYMCKPYDNSTERARVETYKVFHHVFDPTGSRIVTKGPGGLYTHHRGLFYGFNKVSYNGKNVDIWHCKGDAYQSHEGVLAKEEGPVLGRHRIAIDWHGVGGKVFAKEQREMTAYSVPGGILIEFASRLESVVGKVKLDGDPQHAGFHFRADNEVAAKTQKLTYFLRPDGRGKPGETRNWDKRTRKGPVNLPWNAMSFVLGGKRYTVVYLDKPTNPKEARYSERTYGRFGSYFEYELTPTKPLEVNYRIWLQEGEMTVPQASALSADFVTPVKVSAK